MQPVIHNNLSTNSRHINKIYWTKCMHIHFDLRGITLYIQAIAPNHFSNLTRSGVPHAIVERSQNGRLSLSWSYIIRPPSYCSNWNYDDGVYARLHSPISSHTFFWIVYHKGKFNKFWTSLTIQNIYSIKKKKKKQSSTSEWNSYKCSKIIFSKNFTFLEMK